jgi:hypothetical protein
VFDRFSLRLSRRIDVMGDADIDTQALNLQAQRIGECLQSRLAAIVCRVQRSLNRARKRGHEQNVATGLDDVRQDGARGSPRSQHHR